MRKSGIFFSLCAGVVLAGSLCVNVLLYQRLSVAEKNKRTDKRSSVKKTVPGRNPVRKKVVKPSAEERQLLCLGSSVYFDDGKPVIRMRFNLWNMDWDENTSLVQVTPGRKLQFSRNYNGFDITGDFEYEKQYTVLLKKGLRSRNGASLKYDTAFRVKIPPLPAAARFVSGGTIFPSGRKDLFLPMELTNINELHVQVYELYENNLTRYALDYWTATLSRQGRLICEKKISCKKFPRNKMNSYKLRLADLIPDCRSGVYSVEVSHGPYSKIQRVVNLTDLACSAAVDPVAKKAVAAVCSMKNNKPCAGAAVTLISGKHQVLARGTTNPAGIVMLDYSASAAGKDKEDSPEYLLVKSPSGVCTLLRNISDENHSLVPFRNRGHVYDALPRAFIYTERGIYRPGEDLYVSLFLRDSTNKVCRNVPCTVKVSDPKGNVIGSARIKSGPYGFASARFILPADGFSGSYEIRCLPDGSGDPVWGTASFLVSEFTPDRIRVQLKGSGKTLFQGEKLSFQVQADHYYGAPLTKAPCRFQVSALPAALPSAWSSWSVGDKSAFQSGRGHLSTVQIPQGSRTFVYKGFEASGGQAFFPVQLVASAQVRDPGGRTVTAQSHVLYHPFPYYIGLRSGKASALRSAAVEWKLLPAKMETPLSGRTKRTLKISLSRLEWHSVTRRMGSDLRLDWEQRKVPVPDAGSLTTEAVEGVWEKELESGQYEIVFEEGKLRTVLNFYHWRGDDTPRSSNPSVLHCFADKKLYKAGEEALLTFRSPGEGIVLVTGADPRLVSMKNAAVKRGENTVRIRIPENIFSSSFYCSLTLIRKEKRQFGLICLKVDQSARKLNVGISCPEKAVPGGKINLKVTLQDPDGKSASGTVQFYAVDEGILALTGYKTPDIFEFFFGSFRCGLLFADVYSTLYPELKIGPSGRFGGDRALQKTNLMAAGAKAYDGEEDPSRYAPRSVICMFPPMEVKGSAEIPFTVPDHLGALRMMAVASSGKAVGSTSVNLSVRARADLEISGPRIAAPSDQAELTFTLLNSDIPDPKGNFTVKLPSGKIHREAVNILPGKSHTVRLKVQFPAKEGICTIPCELTLGKVTRKKDFRCGVRWSTPPVRKTVLRLLGSGERFRIGKDLQSDLFHTIKNCEVILSPSPAAVLTDALEFLNEYPYGCLEQTVSKAFPLLAVKDLCHTGLISGEMAKGAELKLKRAAGKIHSMMLYNGAFPMWQGLEEEWSSGTVFASHFLCESKSFESSARRKNSQYLRSIVSRKSGDRYERAYAVYVLSLMKDTASVKYARDLLSPADDDFASLLAAFALMESNYAGEGSTHIDRLLKKGVFMDDKMPYFTTVASRKGMVLYLLSKYGLARSNREKLAMDLIKLLRKDGSGWGVTHANSWAVLGLASFFRGQGHTASGEGKVVIREVAGAAGVLRKVTSGNVKIPVKKERIDTLEVENVSPVPVFVRLCAEGRLRKAENSGNGMTLARRFLNSKGKVVTASAAQGDLLTVELTLQSSGPLKDVVICDMLPGGLEIEDDALKTRMKMQKKYDPGVLHVKHVEKRNGSLVLCGDLTGKGIARFRYQVRAVTRGTFAPGSASAEGMYDPGTFGRTGEDQKVFEVR